MNRRSAAGPVPGGARSAGVRPEASDGPPPVGPPAGSGRATFLGDEPRHPAADRRAHTELEFEKALAGLVEPALASARAQLADVTGLDDEERAAVRSGLSLALYQTVHLKVTRTLLLELHAARVSGRLRAGTSRARWSEFLELSGRPQFWDAIGEHYPTLRHRLDRLIGNRCAAATDLARRFATDRETLGSLLGTRPGRLLEIELDAGDSHRGGHTVAILRFDNGTVVYKPRSVQIDLELARFLELVLAGVPAGERIRVPRVVARTGYGWAEHVTHRYCDDDAQHAAFYRGIGHWLAVTRLLGGSDLHAENVIASGPVPVVVDCETLFAPVPHPRPSGVGLAVDRAGRLLDGTVLRTGLLPSRGVALGWRGVDVSAVGSLPGQQPAAQQPAIIDAGTDRARIGLRPVDSAPAANHPSPRPALGTHWEQVVHGFTSLTEELIRLDRAGELAGPLRRFAECPIRVVTRSTEAYAEIARMLWHPVSLYDEPAAVQRAHNLLAKMAENLPLAPADPAVISAEVQDLLDGDIPFFTALAGRGRLHGPAGTRWLPERDLVEDALAGWRSADLALEQNVIRAALVGAYLNEGWAPETEAMRVRRTPQAQLEQRRRANAAQILRRIRDAAIQAEDGTATWVAPVLNQTGWAVQPLSPDLYSGAFGVAVLVAGYLREAAAGRVEEVDGLQPLLAGVVQTLRNAADVETAQRRSGPRLRPESPGGFVGLGSQIWSWLVLERWGVAGVDGTERAIAAADELPESVEADRDLDVLVGMAGAVVPLLHLAARTGDGRWSSRAVQIGNRLLAAARVGRDGACWPTAQWPQGLGGFAHGVTGIGWALQRLGLATGESRFEGLAEAAFAYEESLFDPQVERWRDIRAPGEARVAWCHGAVGIGLARLDLHDRSVDDSHQDAARRAAAAAWATLGWNHTVCHGDFGSWELLDRALSAGVGPPGVTRADVDSLVIGSLDENGPVTGLARNAFAPGLFPGDGGLAYQLLRMHPDADLPSVLTLGGDQG